MRLLYSSLLVCCFCLTALSQIRFHGVLLRDENTEKPVAVARTRVTIAGVGGMRTAPDGTFTFVIPKEWPGGKMVQIRVQKAGYLINVPVDGKWNLPNPEEQDVRRLTVIIVPKGAKKLWSNLRIEKELRDLSEELKYLKAATRNPRPIDFAPYFKRWSAKTGLATGEIKRLFDEWNRSPDDPNDPEKLALKALYRGQYRAAAEYFNESANRKSGEAGLYERLAEGKKLEAARDLVRSGASWLRVNEFWKAAGAFEAAEKNVSPEKHPQVLGAVLHGLSIAKREIGTRAEGRAGGLALHESLGSIRQAAAVLRRAGLAKQLASVESSLGNVLYELAICVGGEEETRLLTEAAAAHRRALEEQVAADQQSDWADTQNRLGLTLTAQAALAAPPASHELFKEAVHAFKQASDGYIREGNTTGWASVQINIAQLLDLRANLGRESPPLLLDEAITARRKALKFYTKEKAPEDWAHILVGMARALTLRGHLTTGDEGDGFLNESEAVLQQALAVNKRDRLAQPWARTHMELAMLYHVRARRLDSTASKTGYGPMTELLKKSLDEFRLALEVFNRENLPKDWALIQINFGQTLGDLGAVTDGQPGVQLLSEAAKASRGALEVYSRKGQPGIWLMAQRQLGFMLYQQALRTSGTEGERLTREAVDAYKQMLEVATPETFRDRWTQAHRELVKIFHATGDASNTVASYAALLKVYPRHYDALRNLSYLYQNVLFDYEKAFETTRRWLELDPHNRRAQVWFAEQHFTTGRFAECERRINELLAEATPQEVYDRTMERMRKLLELAENNDDDDVPSVIEIAPPEASVRRNLHILEIVNLLTLGKDAEVPAKLDALIREMEAPGRFVTPSLDGVIHYVEQNERLPHRAWLRQFFNSFKKENYDGSYKALRKARDDFKPTGRP